MSYLTQFVPHAKVVGQTLLVTRSTTWTPAYSGWYFLFLVGGGGSGAAGSGASNGDGWQLLGGNAGSTVIATRYLTAGTTYTIQIGAGGAAVLCNSDTSGNSGTSTFMSGTGLTTLTATGGRGGSAAIELPYNTALTPATYSNAVL